MSRDPRMNPERKERLWERLYFMNGFGLSDYLNDFIRLPGAHWRATQHGEYAFLEGEHGELFRFDRWDQWRENITYYFDGLCDAAPCLPDETFCDVMVFKVCRMMLDRMLDSEFVCVHESPEAHRLLFC